MLFDIKATKILLTDGILTAVEKKMATLDTKLARYGESVRGRVEVCKITNHHKKGDLYHCQVSVSIPGKKVVAESQNKDLYVAINNARKDAERQIIGFKGKKTAALGRGARTVKRELRGEAPKKGVRVRNEGV